MAALSPIAEAAPAGAAAEVSDARPANTEDPGTEDTEDGENDVVVIPPVPRNE